MLSDAPEKLASCEGEGHFSALYLVKSWWDQWYGLSTMKPEGKKVGEARHTAGRWAAELSHACLYPSSWEVVNIRSWTRWRKQGQRRMLNKTVSKAKRNFQKLLKGKFVRTSKTGCGVSNRTLQVSSCWPLWALPPSSHAVPVAFCHLDIGYSWGENLTWEGDYIRVNHKQVNGTFPWLLVDTGGLILFWAVPPLGRLSSAV